MQPAQNRREHDLAGGSAIPFGPEFQAVKTMTLRVFGLLISLEPVVATLIGFVILQEMLGLREIIEIMLVTIAAVVTARAAQ